MIDLDKFLYFNCPDECGQLAIPCSLRMILNNDVFFCDACGCEFQASVYPQWLPNAVCAENDSNSMIHKDIMVVLYSYLYGNGPCPAENVISQLLQADLNLWTLFPIDKIFILNFLIDNEA